MARSALQRRVAYAVARSTVAIALSVLPFQARAVDGVVATVAITDLLNPFLTQGSAGTAYTANIFDTLVSYNQTPGDGKGRITPGIATSWTVAPDGKSIDFIIRDDAYFHDGSKITAEDVAFSMQMIVDPTTKHPYRSSYFETLQGAEQTGPNTVRLLYSRPWPGTFDALAARANIVPKKHYLEVGPDEYAKKPVGSGPYALTSYRRGDRMELTAMPNYWGGKPYFDKITWRSIPDVNTRVAMLCSGEADAITDIQPSLLETIRSCGANAGVLKGIHQRFLIMNTLHGGPLADKRVRQALNLALDRKPIFDAIFGSNVEWVNGALSAYHIGGKAAEPFPFDPVLAKKLLAEAGYPNGFSTELMYTAGRYVDEAELLPTLVSYWKKIGVNVTTRSVEYNQWINFAGTKAYTGLFSYSKGAGTIADPTSAFDRHVMCGALYSAYCNQELDAIVKSAAGIIDEKKLEEIFVKAQRISHEDPPAVFLYDLPTMFGWKKGLRWLGEYGALEQGGGWNFLTK